MFRLLQHLWVWLRRRITGHTSSLTLLDLPDAAAAVLVSFLDSRSLHAAAMCCRHAVPPIAEAFQSRFVLRIPPDTVRNEVLMRRVTRSSGYEDQGSTNQYQSVGQWPPLPFLATQFAVGDSVHVADLVPLGDHVGRARAVVNCFSELESLVLDHVRRDQPQDLVALSQSCPVLQELVIKFTREITGRLVNLSKLRGFHFHQTNITSFEIAVGLPALQSLTLVPALGNGPLRDVASLADVAPLTQLAMSDWWKELPLTAMATHLLTLRDYAALNPGPIYSNAPWFHAENEWHPKWPRMVRLRSLRIGWYEQCDTTPLVALTALEHLELVIADTCQNCFPLRRLTRLREMRISNGWACDLVGYLPRLEKLISENITEHHNRARTTLCRRYEENERREDNLNNVSHLRQLVMHGNLLSQDSSPSVNKMLQHVEQLEVNDCNHLEALLPSISRLRHLKRLAFQSVDLPWRPDCRRSLTFACADSLEELYYLSNNTFGPDRTTSLPQLLHDRLPKLRVLASPFQESMPALAQSCPHLTHVLVPFSHKCAFSTASPLSLSRLCVVSLPISLDCTWLRNERGPGHALPSLQRIFHR